MKRSFRHRNWCMTAWRICKSFLPSWKVPLIAPSEKNWMGFSAGAEPNKSTTLPEYHYSLVPGRSLHPSNQTPETLQYTLRPSPGKSSCVADKLRADVPNVNTIHHATPLYRMTLCGRRDPACVPRVGNTVLVGLGQVKVVHELRQRYERYVSPRVLWDGKADASGIGFL